MKNKIIFIAVTAAIFVCAAVLTVILFTDNGADNICVYKNGELVNEINLKKVTESYELEIDGSRLLVENDGVTMLYADCPDKICVHRGKMHGGAPIVCMPKKIVITAENNREDAVSW